ncbi:MAG: methionyl-tRNA formyltransferase [Acidimicrobiales bacterium mtb01]|nr:methionyl-tRNA formyltransferase [Actinomycetota bacterium]TEX45027.1 MAG: methionyl-tRNA formyltransferase [Acidimicrobiales bacterium mtb01]
MTDLAPLPSGPILRVVFLGTPAMAVPPLRALVAAGVDVAHVVTRADKRRGRGSELSPSPVKQAALELGLSVSHAVDDVLDVTCDLGVVVAYGALIKPHVLARVPMVNLHFSLLPRWRGAAPVERVLLAGDAETGVCLMRVDIGLDTGGVFDRRTMPIDVTTTADDIRRRLVADGTEMLLAACRQGLAPEVPQAGDAVYADKISPDDLRIDWTGSADRAVRQMRVGGAWTTWNDKRFKIHDARASSAVGGEPGTCRVVDGRVMVNVGRDGLELLSVQPEGKSTMSAAAWANGARPDGTIFA